MRLHVYRGDALEAVFEYRTESGARDGRVADAPSDAIAPTPGAVGESSQPSLMDVPSEWLHWAASIVFPALASGAYVRWYA